ncbi:tail assembly chaperone [Lagierella massiliensis]|uniref:tail assembly chaperone n=1 Tax=Lagierella massiliensis TaxID=1689303 RepID=UPI0006D789DF|nr:tail assembly chaperone [Lagierella massiliensis]
MQLEINKRLYDIYFGIDALATLNRNYALMAEGMNTNEVIGEGLNFLYFGLEALNPVAIKNFIVAGTSTLKSKPSNIDIDNFTVDLIENDKFDDFCKECMDFLENAPLTRKRLQEVKATLQEEKEARKEVKKKA